MAGSRELDLEVSRELFGVKKVYYEDWDTAHEFPKYVPSGKPWSTHEVDAKDVPRFSRDHNAAALVLAEMERRGWDWGLHSAERGEGIRADFVTHSEDKLSARWPEGVKYHEAQADAIPEAICRAALQAVRGEAS